MIISRARFHPVNSKTIRRLRRQLGWSQAELGRRAGYCERVIRKAEAGGSLNMDTIETLVQTFVNHNVKVSTQELIYSEEGLAKKFVESYDSLGVGLLSSCGPFLTDDFVFHLPAERTILKLAGTYNGKTEYQGFLDRFYSFFSRRPDSLNTTYFIGTSRVVAHFEDVFVYRDQELPPVWVNLHFHFRDGLISKIENQFDYMLVFKAIEAIHAADGTGVPPATACVQENAGNSPE